MTASLIISIISPIVTIVSIIVALSSRLTRLEERLNSHRINSEKLEKRLDELSTEVRQNNNIKVRLEVVETNLKWIMENLK